MALFFKLSFIIGIFLTTLALYHFLGSKIALTEGVAEIWGIDNSLKIKIPCFSGASQDAKPFMKTGRHLSKRFKAQYFIAQEGSIRFVLNYQDFTTNYGEYQVMEAYDYLKYLNELRKSGHSISQESKITQEAITLILAYFYVTTQQEKMIT